MATSVHAPTLNVVAFDVVASVKDAEVDGTILSSVDVPTTTSAVEGDVEPTPTKPAVLILTFSELPMEKLIGFVASSVLKSPTDTPEPILIPPATANFAIGLVVPMPTLPVVFFIVIAS